MKCIYDELMLSQYIEKDMTSETMRQLDSHIQECPICSKRIERLKTAIKIMQSVEEVNPPRDYIKRVRKS
jgi:hypothetical protein